MADILCYTFILSISEGSLLSGKKFIFKNSRYFAKLEWTQNLKIQSSIQNIWEIYEDGVQP